MSIKGHEFDVLTMDFKTQTELLRFLTDIDLRIFFGFVTVQLGAGAFLAQHPINRWSAVGLLLVDLAMAAVAMNLLYLNRRRREEVSRSVWRLNEALGLSIPGTYLPTMAIHDAPKAQPLPAWWRFYAVGCIVATVGSALILFTIGLK